MKLGYEQILQQTQKLAMTPELIQAIQILQYNSLELSEHIEEELLENPMLEVSTQGDEYDDPEPVEIPIYEELSNKIIKDAYYEKSFRAWENDPDSDSDFTYEKYISEETTLYDYLIEQLTFTDLGEDDVRIGEYIINEIDEGGYLRAQTEEIAQVFGVQASKVEEVIKVVQSFEPRGIGARDLKECLLIQINLDENLGEDLKEEFTQLINEHVEDLARNRIAVISKQMGKSPERIQEMLDYIKTLDPKPGNKFSSGSGIKYVVPDLTLEIEEGEFHLVLNDDSTPRLMISSYYKYLSKEVEDDDRVAKYFSDRLSSAMWFIKNIEQRKKTIYSVAEEIIKEQRDFFLFGDKYMKPLTLREIAEPLEIHESTVSRAVNGKYILTPRGLFELKYFFSSGLGYGREEISSNSIKSFIADFIEKENPKKPLSDQKIMDMLQDKGIDIKRRTIAKYREAMGIPSSSKRRRF